MSEAKQKILFDSGERKYQRKDKVIFLIYSLCLILSPIYLWKSGLPQIADFMFLILLFTYSIIKKFKFSLIISTKKVIGTALLFTAYVVVVNLVWTMILTTDSFLRPSLFYVFNFIILFLGIILYKDYKTRLVEVTYKALLVSLAIQTGIVLVAGFTGARMTGSFNNPNQLAYYSVLTLSFLIYASSMINIKVKYFLLGIVFSSVLVAASLSKAGILAYLGLLLTYVFFNNKNKNKKMKIKFIIALILIGSIAVFLDNVTNMVRGNQLVRSVVYRIDSIGEDQDDTLDGRGYNRIAENQEYLIFGAGEGEFGRFKSLAGREFHSTLGSLLVSYGILGVSLFLMILYWALKNDRFRSWNIIVFIMVYGLTHNGIRESLLWLLVALISTGAIEENNKPGLIKKQQ